MFEAIPHEIVSTTTTTTPSDEPESPGNWVQNLLLLLLIFGIVLLATIELTLLYCLRRLFRPLAPPIAVQNPTSSQSSVTVWPPTIRQSRPTASRTLFR